MISADNSKQPQKGKILTGDANTDNSIVSGVLGFGLGVGGVLLAQSFLESQKNPCRHRRDTGVQPRFIGGGLGGLGLGGGHHNKPCYPPPAPYPGYPGYYPPPPAVGGYGPPPPHYPPPQYPPQYSPQYAPQYPQGGYNAPSGGYNAPSGGYNAPSSGYNAPSSGYNAPSSGYNAPSGGYNAPSYTPPSYTPPTYNPPSYNPPTYRPPTNNYNAPSYAPTYNDNYNSPGHHGFRSAGSDARSAEVEATKSDLDHSEFRIPHSRGRSLDNENPDTRSLLGGEESSNP